MDFGEARNKVLEWVEDADSYDRLGFIFELLHKLSADEQQRLGKHIKNEIRKPEVKKRKWQGPSYEESCRNAKRIFRLSEDPTVAAEDNDSENWDMAVAPSLLRLPILRCEELPRSWTKDYTMSDILALDCEHVSVFKQTGIKRQRAGTVGVVDAQFGTVLYSKVYHGRGTFDTHPKTLVVTGIESGDLADITTCTPMTAMTIQMKNLLANKLIIYTADISKKGATDFSGLDLEVKDFDTFNLQQFYRRHNETGRSHGMSLRDMYFLEFQKDFQGTAIHSSLEDAEATMKVFLHGYIQRMWKNPNRDNRDFTDFFDESVSLKKMEELGKRFCNTDNVFKEKNECKCSSCLQLFSNKYSEIVERIEQNKCKKLQLLR